MSDSLKIDGAILAQSPEQAGPLARSLEVVGFDGGFTFEGPHDPFLPLVVAAQSTERLELSTAVAIGLVRSPLTLAQLAYDLQTQSRGRFTLGLGSQVRAHVQRRYGMPWSRPTARMRELVGAIRAIWRCWHEGERLDFRGDFYTHTLMPPLLSPGPNPFGLPRVFVAGVGPRMTEVAGEVGDGHLVHPLHTRDYLVDVLLPAIERGMRTAGRVVPPQIACQVIVATGADDEELRTAVSAARMQIAFYASTPAYRHVLAHHGLEGLHTELHALSRSGAWPAMSALVGDELLERVAVVGLYEEAASKLHERYAGLVERIGIIAPATPDPQSLGRVIGQLRVAAAG